MVQRYYFYLYYPNFYTTIFLLFIIDIIPLIILYKDSVNIPNIKIFTPLLYNK